MIIIKAFNVNHIDIAENDIFRVRVAGVLVCRARAVVKIFREHKSIHPDTLFVMLS